LAGFGARQLGYRCLLQSAVIRQGWPQ